MSNDAREARRERLSRLKRLTLVGAIVSMLLFVGLFAAEDAVQPAPETSMVTTQRETQNTPSADAPRPRIRTRTS